jgi:osmoprotectant transport system permease protein
MNDTSALGWLFDPANWTTTYAQVGIPQEILEHLEYSAIALGIALVLALPAGLIIGHTGRGTAVVSALNGLRALPSLGLLVLFYVLLAPHFHGRSNAVFLIPTEIVLVLLAVPPILANTFAGVQNVDPAVRDAAVGMGMTGRQTLLRVELPNALPLIFSGFRSATLQVIATATVAAYVGLGGLGRFVYDGLASHNFAEVTGGAILVALLALAADLTLALVQRYTVSPGVSGRVGRGRRTADPIEAQLEELEVATNLT